MLDHKLFIIEKTVESLGQIGLRPSDVEVRCYIERRTHKAIVLVDVRPRIAALWRYGPHVEHFVIERIRRKYTLQVATVRLSWHREVAFKREAPIEFAEPLYRALRDRARSRNCHGPAPASAFPSDAPPQEVAVQAAQPEPADAIRGGRQTDAQRQDLFCETQRLERPPTSHDNELMDIFANDGSHSMPMPLILPGPQQPRS